MNIRRQIEQHEKNTLSAHACQSANTRGRREPQHADDIRTEFQRDRDRILHSKAFRRLMHKTQVFLSPKSDHVRTRLTHTLEVSQVARTLARSLNLNEDLTEAIALGHDLGHTPFGHMGERTLDALCPQGFSHAEQSLRVVDRLEGDSGLNLTWEVRDGIVNHCGDTLPSTLEGVCVREADRIAYINHDIDDAIRAGMLRPEDIPAQCVSVLGNTHSQRINHMVSDIITNSMGKGEIIVSRRTRAASEILRGFLFNNVYRSDWANIQEKKVNFIITSLYGKYKSNPAIMNNEMIEIAFNDGIDRAVCDYIAGMTDRFAVNDFTQQFIPPAFTTI